MKRSVALVVVTAATVGGAGYALMPGQDCGSRGPAVESSGSRCGSGGARSAGSGGHGFFGSSGNGGSGGASGDAGGTQRGGFGSFARSVGAHFGSFGG